MISGIYKITNIKNNKVYIGESIDIRKRWLEHLEELKNNKHINYKLQKDYNIFGKENFKFEIIDICDIEKVDIKIKKCLLLIYENKYIKKYDSINNGYNIEFTLKECLLGNKETNYFSNKNMLKKLIISTLKKIKSKIYVEENGFICLNCSNMYKMKDVRKRVKLKGTLFKQILRDEKIINDEDDININLFNGYIYLNKRYNDFTFDINIFNFICKKVEENKKYNMKDIINIDKNKKINKDIKKEILEEYKEENVYELFEIDESKFISLSSFIEQYTEFRSNRGFMILRNNLILEYKMLNNKKTNVPCKEYINEFILVKKNCKDGDYYYQLYINKDNIEEIIKLF